MPIHDWTRVPAGTFHSFHQRWISALADALNGGGLPAGHFALSEVDANGPLPDVIALKAQPPLPPSGPAGLAVADAPPRARVVSRGENTAGYARRADHLSRLFAAARVGGRHRDRLAGKQRQHERPQGVRSQDRQTPPRGVHLLVVDLLPPSVRDPQGIHKAIWDKFKEEPFELPAAQPLTLTAYAAGSEKVAYVKNVAVGDRLPEMPIFLTPDHYAPCPLEPSYEVSWGVFPRALKGALDGTASA